MRQTLPTIQQRNDSIVVYKSSDGVVQLDVQMADETVWLTLNQLAVLFNRNKSVISRHISNIYSEGELVREATVAKNATVQNENGRQVVRQIEYYNLDVIISVGYRVKSLRGTQFRIWASRVLKDYLMRGYSVNNRLERLEQRVTRTEEKIDFFVRTALPPTEGIFYDGQIFDAYVFAIDLIKSAKRNITLIDNYIDESVLVMLAKRKAKVSATILTNSITKTLQLDIDKFNNQYSPIKVDTIKNVHDRFLIIDKEVYHIGASLKDLGKKLFAFSKLGMSAEVILSNINTTK